MIRDDFLRHIGTKRHSGRYPWGSGENPRQREQSFLELTRELKKEGLTEKEIADHFDISINKLREMKTVERDKEQREKQDTIQKLIDKGYSNMAIERETGIPNETVSYYRNKVEKNKASVLQTTVDLLKDELDKGGYLQVGVGVERYLGIKRPKLKAALSVLKDEGYTIHYIDAPNVGTKHKTSVMVLAKPDVGYREVFLNQDQIRLINHVSRDDGQTFTALEPIRFIDSSRIDIRYAEDGGNNKDGVIELRRGVEELSLGDKRYAQVRIGVDKTHFLKGMALYSDEMPPGKDIVFYTNKPKGTPKEDVFKPLKMDPDDPTQFDPNNPFKAIVSQRHYIDKDGKEQLSAIQRVGYKEGAGEEGSWGEWTKALSSQMLSKQPPALAKKQLDLAYEMRKTEYDTIQRLTNPVVKEKLLLSFSDDADSAAVHLKAAALPRQRTQVILPVNSLKPNEIYAPNYNNGEQVVLIRHPHGGIFEIPQLTVNNNNREGKRVLGQSEDAVGINPSTAQQLSGADFDGDNVLVIPNPPGIDIKTAPYLKTLREFEPRIQYKAYEGMPRVGPEEGFYEQQQMGSVSNLITDMTIQGASLDKIARAVKHSMVIIDAEKHNLNWRQSYLDNGIAALKKEYQGGANRGASTLISKSNSDLRIPLRKERYRIDPETGKKIYSPVEDTYNKKGELKNRTSYVNKQGKVVYLQTKSTPMAETDDANTLSSGTLVESVYANHANKLKALANTARKDSLSTDKLLYSPSAAKIYAKEVSSLNAQLNIALKNAPLERQALLITNYKMRAIKQENPDMDAKETKKVEQMVVMKARATIGAKKEPISISDKEWEAIQAGAISNSALKVIMANTDLERLKELATPRDARPTITVAKLNKAKRLLEMGYTQAEVAEALGISVSTLSNALK